jgi:hypothetical protein
MYEQQLYTRTNYGGIRAGTPGFDTVAASPGLTKNDLADIEQLCEYRIPQEYYEADPEHLAPEVHYMCETQRGNVVIGMSVYRKEEGDRGRSVFLSHNFILKPADEDYFEAMISIDDYVVPDSSIFMRTFSDDGQRIALDPKPRLATGAAHAASRDVRALQRLGIEHGMLVKLAFAVFAAIEKNRKIFIALPCEDAELYRGARTVLAQLFELLPYDVRFKCGFNTFFTGEGTKKGLVLHFMPKALAPSKKLDQRVGERNIVNDFVFNFASGYITNVDGIERSAPQLWEFLNQQAINSSELDKIWNLAHVILADQGKEVLMNIPSYNNIAKLWTLPDHADTNELFDLAIECSNYLDRTPDNEEIKNRLLELLDTYQVRFAGERISIPDDMLFLLGRLTTTHSNSFAEVSMRILQTAFVLVEQRREEALALIDEVSQTGFPPEFSTGVFNDIIAEREALGRFFIQSKLLSIASICGTFVQASKLFEELPVFRTKAYTFDVIAERTEEIERGFSNVHKLLQDLELAWGCVTSDEDLKGLCENEMRSVFNQIDLDTLPALDVQQLSSCAHGIYRNLLKGLLRRYRDRLMSSRVISCRIDVLSLLGKLTEQGDPDFRELAYEVLRILFETRGIRSEDVIKRIEIVKDSFSLAFYDGFINGYIAKHDALGREFVRKWFSDCGSYRAVFDAATTLFRQYPAFEDAFRSKCYGENVIMHRLGNLTGESPFTLFQLSRYENAKTSVEGSARLQRIYGDFASHMIMNLRFQGDDEIAQFAFNDSGMDLGPKARQRLEEIRKEQRRLQQLALQQYQLDTLSAGTAYKRPYESTVLEPPVNDSESITPPQQDSCDDSPAAQAPPNDSGHSSEEAYTWQKLHAYETRLRSYLSGRDGVKYKKLYKKNYKTGIDDLPDFFTYVVGRILNTHKSDANKEEELKTVFDCTRDAIKGLGRAAIDSSAEEAIEKVFSYHPELHRLGFTIEDIFPPRRSLFSQRRKH